MCPLKTKGASSKQKCKGLHCHRKQGVWEESLQLTAEEGLGEEPWELSAQGGDCDAWMVAAGWIVPLMEIMFPYDCISHS